MRLKAPLLAVAMLLLALCAGAPVAQAQDRDCSDFANQAAAQGFYEANGGPSSDPHQLDADDDGVACESRPCPCRGAKQPPAQDPPPPPPPSDRDGDGVPDASDACLDQAGTEPNGCQPPAPAPPVVVRVVDGDTLVVRTSMGVVTVRLLGIDAPEKKKCGAKQATSLLRKLAQPGEVVELGTDDTQAQFDKYERLLAYVTGDDGRLMQTDILRAGWSKIFVVGERFTQYKTFAAVQKKAKRKPVGLWAKCR